MTMARRRRVLRVGLSLPAQEDQRGDGPGAASPDLLGHGAKELEGRDQALKDRLGTSPNRVDSMSLRYQRKVGTTEKVM
jgi:hypothetical protein